MKHFKTKFIIIIASIVSLIAITLGVYAYVSRISARGEISVSATTINAKTTYTSSTDIFEWTYIEAGDIKEINITTENQTDVILHRYYNIQLAKDFTSDENLLKAIIVYYNNTYIGTLNDVVSKPLKIEEKYNFIGLASNKTDGFKFELHQAAKNSILDNKDVKVTITTFTENADYYKYIFVKSEADFKKAIDDMNSGMLSETPTIVLCNNITLTNNYTISEPTTIYMNGSTLNGDLTINDTTATDPNALLEVFGEGAFNGTVTLGDNYDQNGAINLVKNHVKDVLKDGVSAGSTTNILGHYAFYGISVSAITRCTFTSPDIIVQNSSNEYYNALGAVKVHNDEIINFKILGSKTELIDGTLAHLPQNRTISLDLFLPTYIPSQNASITWKSSDESIITNTGKITAKRLENAAVTLYAEIRVNEKVFTRTFNFKVSAHNNEINFYKLVQEISPIVISNVRNSEADDNEALYHLPIVNDNGAYDYRTSYTSPVNTELFKWSAYRNIGLKSITYKKAPEQEKFDYITLENPNKLYLNNITLNNYASITITGDFGNEEKYSTNINISISVGSNTQLLEKTFSQISDELSQISILGNILSTRIQNGMANEKGDFSLSTRYLDEETNELSEDYSVEYSGESNIITSITKNEETGKYDFSINPEYFNEYETTVAFTATVYYRKDQTGETSKSRTFYITVPAALHIKDFGTISIYNATKYQVFNQLPANEKTGTTGYTVSGTSLTDNNLDYILLRDIVGDRDYLAQYNHNDTSYLKKINYTSSNYAPGTESLSYLTSSTNPTSTTDTLAYDFARLIEWATGDT
ncbi:MAG: immunoglobulin-like domain-containing protein, partial [Anaeroplasma sp.]|uniref:immunoglobulin-like domain-containing protein n=1 Tax=Anaeroplasma sp. TaxID=1872523 RepID=UPI002A91015E